MDVRLSKGGTGRRWSYLREWRIILTVLAEGIRQITLKIQEAEQVLGKEGN